MDWPSAIAILVAGLATGGVATYRIMYDRCYNRALRQVREETKHREKEAEDRRYQKAIRTGRITEPREDAGRAAVIHKAKVRKSNRNPLAN